MSQQTYTRQTPRPLPRQSGYMSDPVRGARLGRPTTDPDTVPPASFRFYLQRVRLDQGGYDEGGAYWGMGAPLYRFEAGEGPDDLAAWPAGFLRARDRQAAKAKLRADYPGARFYA